MLLIIRRSPVATQHVYDVCQHEMDDPSQLHVGISKFDVKTSKSNIITKWLKLRSYWKKVIEVYKLPWVLEILWM